MPRPSLARDQQSKARTQAAAAGAGQKNECAGNGKSDDLNSENPKKMGALTKIPRDWDEG